LQKVESSQLVDGAAISLNSRLATTFAPLTKHHRKWFRILGKMVKNFMEKHRRNAICIVMATA
jgi:hypothetical protein